MLLDNSKLRVVNVIQDRGVRWVPNLKNESIVCCREKKRLTKKFKQQNQAADTESMVPVHLLGSSCY